MTGPFADREEGAEGDRSADDSDGWSPDAAFAPGGGAGSSGAFPGAVIPLHEMERLMIMKGLEATAGNRTQAAELLGISVRTLRNKLNEYRGMGMEIE